MQHRVHRQIPLAGFSLVVAIIVAIITVYSVNEHRRLRARMEESLVREGLAIIAVFEASVYAGLKGPRQLNRERFLDTMKDTCRRAEVDYVWLVLPSKATNSVTRVGYLPPLEPTLTNLQARLATRQYCWRYEIRPDGALAIAVSRPLLLDYESNAGVRTFRLYKLLGGGTNDPAEPSYVQRLASQRRGVRSLPIITIAMPAGEIQVLGRETLVRSLSLGLIVLLFSGALGYIAVVIQQHRAVARTLESVRAENERLLRHLRRADQLAVIDRMAATMAHELRNSLGALRMFAQMAREPGGAADAADTRRNADLVVREIDRLNAVINTVLGLSRPVEPQCVACRLDAVIEDTVGLLRYDTAARNVTIDVRVAPGTPQVMADPALLAQMLMNLIANSCDAMPEGGMVTIEAGPCDAGRVRLVVRDTGSGIRPEHLAQVFEPFFTTKAGGTGLGLATVESVVSRHNGTIQASSGPGSGATFTIELPVTQGSAS